MALAASVKTVYVDYHTTPEQIFTADSNVFVRGWWIPIAQMVDDGDVFVVEETFSPTRSPPVSASFDWTKQGLEKRKKARD